MTLQELLSQKAELDQKIEELQRASRSEAIEKIRALMEENRLSLADLSERSTSTKKAASSGSKVAAKYRNTETGETWSGRGLQPRWLRAALEQGRQLNDFLIAA